MTALTVALLGGESSGKTMLALALTRQLNTLGVSATLVQEHLRAWCEREGRAPKAHEQGAIAAEQARQIEAATHDGAQVVVADTSALVVAAYSERIFNDRSLWPAALKAQQGFHLNLLMGLDLPWQADGLFRDGPGMRADIDTVLRRELQAAGIPFQTVYGAAEARLQHALRAVGVLLGRALVAHDPLLENGTGRWTCENCSDPACERRLFSGLLNCKRSSNYVFPQSA